MEGWERGRDYILSEQGPSDNALFVVYTSVIGVHFGHFLVTSAGSPIIERGMYSPRDGDQ
jgi:hypothetical protein